MKSIAISVFTITFTMSIMLADFRSGFSATIEPLGFSEMIRNSSLAIEGTVIALKVVSMGNSIQHPNSKIDVSPAKEQDDTQAPAETAKVAEPTFRPPQSVGVEGEGVGVEGGRMIFTEVTLAVEREIVGFAGPTVTFRIPGGDDGQTRVTVAGTPKFELDKRYIVFLRPDFDATAVPIIGVNQGYFQIGENRETGEKFLLNANEDIVLGIENDQAIVRYNPKKTSRPAPKVVPAPLPTPGANVDAQISPEVTRYWYSVEPAMPLSDFLDAVWERTR